MRISIYSLFVLAILVMSCKEQLPQADLIIKGGTIYTVSDHQKTAEAVAVKDNKIIFVGSAKEVEKYQSANTKQIDLAGKTMTPGFIEGHGHFMGLGYNELNLDLLQTKSYEEVIEKVKEAVAKSEPGQWITGRGWHQSKWKKLPEKTIKGFPLHDALSAVSPDNPVYLRHASGHASLANEKAMQIAGVLPLSKEQLGNVEVEGGEIFRDENGNPTGVFNE